ncbi:MAG TPA: tRNA (N(6)-L-threonylcarbamoyladenosine(37)-C(2))-methylthiotransferase MtaB [Desulfuromonadales bacterium]|nr:tRNA (N(6)-L-threonylcarbamoyladenosine(37)-C(2))-methylthiotransferase MtaB [Desulfuromonadales bacterium]
MNASSDRTASVVTLGCKTNQYESAAMEERLRGAGYDLVDFESGADLVIVNTCTVTSATDSQSRNLIRRARRFNACARVVVTGCYAQIDPDALRAIPGVSVVLGNDEKKDFLQALEISGERTQVRVSDIRRAEKAVPLTLSTFAERSRAFLQIQNGCDAFCSYCIIPYARGRSRSVLPGEVVSQTSALVEQGFPEVVLTGIHIGGYGRDLEQPLDLATLARRLVAESGVSRLRLGSVEPTEITEDLIETVAASAPVCPHFHIPLQSGSDTVLEAMNRHYDTAFFRRLTERIRTILPDAAIGIDVIAGFPGESSGLFEETRRFIESLPLTHLHVFPYSRRPGTPAARMPGQVPGDVARERARHLRIIGQRKEEAFSSRFISRTMDVVVEGGTENGLRKGVTENYLAVHFPAGDEHVRQSVAVKIEAFSEGRLVGRLAD